MIENIEINLTSYLQSKKNLSIKKLLDILDMYDVNLLEPKQRDSLTLLKKKLRKCIIEEINELSDSLLRTIVYIQEKVEPKNGL